MTVSDQGGQVGPFPKRTSAAVLALLGVAILVVARTLLGDVLGDPIHPVTYAGLAGGLVGSVVMLVAIEATLVQGQPPAVEFYGYYLGDGNPHAYRGPGTTLHLVYGTAVGGLYPRLAHLSGVSGDVWATFPWSLAAAAGFATLLWALGVGYGAIGLFQFDVERSQLLHFLGFHLLYGLTLGLVVGIWGLVW